MLTRSTRDTDRTEAFSRLATAGLTGFGMGAAATGQVADNPNWAALMFVPPAVACVAALVLRTRLDHDAVRNSAG